MRRKIVAGNWKMNGNQAFIEAFISDFSSLVDPEADGQAELILAPPLLYIERLRGRLAQTRVKVSAQNVSAYEDGAFTGEVSARMLGDLDVPYCIVGHSERRALFAETDQDVVRKVTQLLQEGIIPIVCVGETEAERESGDFIEVVTAQVLAVLDGFSETSALASMVLAYEPVWAIGTGKTATPEMAQQMHKAIRVCLASRSEELAQKCPILYGGSVKALNAKELFDQPDIDGGLVGGASLQAEEFSRICECIG